MPVLGTKLHVPAMRRRLVSRPRLTDRLRAEPASMPRLVLVSAPAGFGKTTLIAQWLASGEPPGPSPRVAWLSLDAEDSELRRFLPHLVAAGISAAIAGLLFIVVQINHPAMDVSSVTTTEWVLRQTAKTVMAAAALAGITGMYLRQVRQTGVLGLVGYLVFGVGYLAMFGIEFVGAAVLPSLAHTAPGFVNDVLAAGTGGTVKGDIGLMQTAFAISAAGYLAGGVLFGLALFRARILARWASALLVLGTLATLALHVLPHSFERPLAVPTGVALIGLGISLWRDQRKTAAVTVSDLPPARAEAVVR